ncbi:MAG TPA: electron transfer flavoprotein-ubiquinone oxidoreductase, partial [Brevundimonas sp.]|nr:electron transfer flavoprotein-ubiquinone oxidoreductase [Brevundimonas sp.]
DEFQRFKHHPDIAEHLEGGTRISYGARAITEGGFQSVPKLSFPGGALIGCSAGFVNVPRIKGSHNAMKTGMLAADAAYDAVHAGREGDQLVEYQAAYETSWVYKELKQVRNAKPYLSKFGIGLKELWQVPAEKHRPGLAQHTTGWPLDEFTGGGSFMYHFGDRYVAIGYVVHLNYKNPFLSPFDEFQRFKHHPAVAEHLEGAMRVSYGARAITEGGFQSVPKLSFPGGVLIGCSAGFVNVPRIKGSHNAMKTGMLAADAAYEAVVAGRSGDQLVEYQTAYEKSWVYQELRLVRNAKPLLSKLGTSFGGALGLFDMWFQTVFGGFSLFGTLKHGKTDAAATQTADRHKPIVYPKPDGKLSFDKLSSVFVSNTNHAEEQPAHLKLVDPSIPIRVNLPEYGEPARLYCPAGVYEVLYDEGGNNPRFQINAQNCVHCKTCDIKDPSQNIVWTTPEGGGGPNYPNM